MRRFVALAAICLACSSARAHEVRPAYLEIRESDHDVYGITWKQPTLAQARIAIDPELPATCTQLAERRVDAAAAALVARWRVRCAGGLHGKAIRIAGLERTLTSAFIRVELADGRVLAGAVRGADPVFQVADAQPHSSAYLLLGVEHILKGIDHVFFVIGLILLVPAFWKLVQALTAFTVAHSITLGAAATGLAGLPQRPVEVVIALSILVVGYEIVRAARGRTGLTSAIPWAVAFGFGLLHGFGFAGALAEVGLPRDAQLGALLLFNLGVEAGQLAIVAVALPIAWWARTRSPSFRSRFELGAGYALGGAASFWLIERVAAAI
jgi:hydrogenase/urease accessory protein HupE